MDPYVSTIIKQGMVLGAFIGLVVAGAYIYLGYSRLQYALTLNMTPPQVP